MWLLALLVWVKCYLNWFLVFFKLRKPLLIVFTGAVGGGKSSSIQYIQNLPGAVGILESSDKCFQEFFFANTPQKPGGCRHLLFSIVIPKTMIAISLVRRRTFVPHLVAMDRLSLDNLAFSYCLNFNEPAEHLTFCKDAETSLRSYYRMRIYFIEYSDSDLHWQVIRDRSLKPDNPPKEQEMRNLEAENYDWFWNREVSDTIRYFYRVCGYPPSSMRRVIKTSSKPEHHQRALLEILADAL